MRVAIFGTGYVGLVTGTCLAEVGHHVVCVDIDQAKVDGLNKGVVPIYEPGLSPMVKANHAARRLFFTTDAASAIAHGDIVFIAVGTPPDEDGSADLQYVLAVARTIGQHIQGPTVVVNKSTVPVGTADKVRAAIAAELDKRGETIEFDVVSNPEFLKEGDAVADCMRPDRIVIGSSKPGTAARLRRLYAPFNRNHDRIVEMDVRSAELTKYAANAMLATRISFMNELANLAELLGADIEAVRMGIGSDPRIGPHFLYAGMGYGGSCFPKDVKALLKTSVDHGRRLHLLNAIETVNEEQKAIMFDKIVRHFGSFQELRGKTLALWGLSFKPNTDDMREAPSLVLIRKLLEAGCKVRAYDPVASSEARRLLLQEHGEEAFGGQITLCGNAWEAVEGCDALALVTEWKEFRSPDFERLTKTLAGRAIFDGRNLYDPATVADAGLAYYGIGRRGQADAR